MKCKRGPERRLTKSYTALFKKDRARGGSRANAQFFSTPGKRKGEKGKGKKVQADCGAKNTLRDMGRNKLLESNRGGSIHNGGPQQRRNSPKPSGTDEMLLPYHSKTCSNKKESSKVTEGEPVSSKVSGE